MTDTCTVALVSNGLYENRGCEAIVRGTMEILRKEYRSKIAVKAGVIASPSAVEKQGAGETDPSIDTFSLRGLDGPRWSPSWIMRKSNERLNTYFYPHLGDLRRNLSTCELALEVGGDNYSLDYGRPTFHLATDRYLMRRGIPVVLWGASIGPFDADPTFSKRVFKHLLELDAVFVRESESFEYLAKNGIHHNVHLMADPAFAMAARKPAAHFPATNVLPGTIGINLSYLIAYFSGATYHDLGIAGWGEFCAEIVRETLSLGRPVLLIPHVGSARRNTEDFALARQIRRLLSDEYGSALSIVEEDYSAAEFKWIISQCAVFAGARTHATIAAISSMVPTLSIGYSLKARGINHDVFGHGDFCIPASEVTPKAFVGRLAALINNERSIREHLEQVVPRLEDNAWRAGAILRAITTGMH